MRTRKTRTEYLEQLSEEELYRHAVNKTLYILEHTDKSEADLRRKLKEAAYPEDIIERALQYVREYHYIDDARFALNYVRMHAAALSRRELSNKLLQKGISREYIDSAFEAYEEEQAGLAARSAGSDDPDSDIASLSTEEQAAVRALRKKLNGRTVLDDASKQKAVAYMYRKGFARDAIYRAFDILEVSVDADAFTD
jgi:regulatory protein